MFLLSHHKINHARDVTWKAEIQLSDKKIIQSSSSPIRSLDGTYYGRIWEFVDITERVQRERNLSEASPRREEARRPLLSQGSK